MKTSRCPITYEEISGKMKYSVPGLRKISSKLKNLKTFPFTIEAQRREAAHRATKMSIQGVQQKLSAVLSLKDEVFQLVDTGGKYILKPQHHIYEAVPENEDLTMKLAAIVGLEVPLHGMLHCLDGSLTYFIKRFDRYSKGKRLAVEDFAQLLGKSRDTKYQSSMEQVAGVIEEFCTFPALEKSKLFKLTIFNFLIGNEDAHLKNFSLLTREDGSITLSPAYDLLNSTIVIAGSEQLALSLNGKKNKLKRTDFLDYFAHDRLEISDKIIDSTLTNFAQKLPEWKSLIDVSFLPAEQKEAYHDLLSERGKILGVI